MKKIIYVLMSLLIMGGASFAQNNAAKPSKTKATKQAGDKAPVKAPAPAKTADKKAAPKMKKDGTPDMRTKENKAAAKPATHLKKDGTPDMRYKENKNAAATKK